MAVAGLTFLLVYSLFLQSHVGTVIARNNVPLDRVYYQGVFDNLPAALLLFTAVILSAAIFYRRIRTLLLWFEGREHLLLFFCITILVVVQIVETLGVQSIPGDDSLEYLKLSNSLFEHHAYVNDLGFPTSYWPVGYPIYLTVLRILFGNTILAARLMNIVISIALVLTTFAVFRPWLNPRERVVFIFISALLPNLVFSANVLLSDYLFTLLLWLAVLVYLRRARSPAFLIAVGVILAVMSYLRPLGLLLPLVFLYSLWKEREVKANRFAPLAGLLVFALALTPWTVRNYSVFHTFVPVATNGGYNFLMGNRHGAPGGVNHDFEYSHANPNEAEESAKAILGGVREIASHPGEAFLRLPRKIYELYRRGDSSLSWALKRTEQPLNPFLLSFLFCTTNVVSYFIVFLSLVTLLGKFVSGKSIPVPKVAVHVFCYFILVTLVFVGSERYLIPIFPLHQFLAAKFVSLGGAAQTNR